MILFYDTETTGIPDFKAPSEAAHQPKIVQIAALLVNEENRKIVSSIDLIIEPDGWTIPEELTGIHGISTELANDVGVPLKQAIDIFFSMWLQRKRVAFNESFDARMVRIAQHQLGYDEDQLEAWKNGAKECAMYGARKYTNLPGNKLPKLREAYLHFTGKKLENAHSAMADTVACMEVYFAIKDQEAKQWKK